MEMLSGKKPLPANDMSTGKGLKWRFVYLFVLLNQGDDRMKRLMILSLMFLGILLVAPAFSHHAAEGIVSDDIWQRIDSMLEDADSPHLNIDFDNVMDSMGVAETRGGGEYCSGNNDCGGQMLLETSIVVPTEYADDYLMYIDLVVAESNRTPSGKVNSGRAPTLEVIVEDLEDDFTQIFLYEPIGSGRSQIPDEQGSKGKR